MKRYLLMSVYVIALVTGCSGPVQETKPDDLSAETPSVQQERTAGYNPQNNAYFGDLHVHTKLSFDAYIFNVRATPDDAYRYAKGETIGHAAGYDIKLAGPPLDFMAVTDHGEYLGVLENMNTEGSELSQHPLSSQLFSTDIKKINAAFIQIAYSLYLRSWVPGLKNEKVMGSAWKQVIDAADAHYVPGKFTTFLGYEFTSAPGAGNLHRNVIYRGTNAPGLPFTAMDSHNPEDLWKWLDAERADGREALAIPHNPNVSNNTMFELNTFKREVLDESYADLRMRNEPLVEMTQIKGTSETHPILSPNDEFADFEVYETMLGTKIKGAVGRGSYVRGGYRYGLELQAGRGFNPYKFGMIGASDSHVGGGGDKESNYFSKVGVPDGLPVRRGSVPPGGEGDWSAYEPDPEKSGPARYSSFSASGLAGVWAEENTREAIYDALRRKETFATSGPRISVRFFAGARLDESILNDPDMIEKAYTAGVPMGGDLSTADGEPNFLVWAAQDVSSAPLQRVQIIKGWTVGFDSLEQVYDIACVDEGVPDPVTHRCPDNGAAVDLKTCEIRRDTGAAELRTLWRDPDYNPTQHAFYYVRVLENPICRWSTWDANRAGVQPSPFKPSTVQERAWSSPIWSTPTKG